MPLDPVPNTTPIVEGKKPSFIWMTWFFNLHQRVIRSGLFLNITFVEQAASPYAMIGDDEMIAVEPNDSSTVRIDLIPGEDGRVIRIRNTKTGAAATVAIYSQSPDFIQLTAGTDPTTTGPFNLSKGQDVDFVFVAEFGGTTGAWGIL